MAATVARMTKRELREMMDVLIEQKRFFGICCGMRALHPRLLGCGAICPPGMAVDHTAPTAVPREPQKLLELLGDPDEGLEIRKSLRDRLLRQKRAVAAGKRGEPFDDVARRLDLE